MSINLESKYILFLIIILVSCRSDKYAYENKGSNVETVELRNKYLEEIYESDQSLRALFSSSNFTTEETHEFWKVASRTDSINLIKIDSYLDRFEYPDTLNYTKKAIKAPWFVIQHCPKINIRVKYYNLLKEAFKDGKINEIDFYLYLQRNYYFERKEMLGIENDDKYSFEEKIYILQDSLGYEH